MFNSSGISASEAKRLAKSQGYSETQINEVQKRAKTNKNENPAETIISDQNGLNKQTVLESEMIEAKENVNDIKQDEMVDKLEDLDLDQMDKGENFESKFVEKRKLLKHFGYEIFERDPELFQESSVGVVDPNYLIGPGDEIIVMLWGQTEFRQVLKVNREGFIFITEIGQIFVNGLNLNMLESKLFKLLSQSFASLNPGAGRATTFLDVSLGNLRPLRIQVLGAVKQPGAYTVSPSATLFSSLYYFNGPSLLGSLRDIHLIRGGKKIASIDFYDFLLSGKKLEDEKLQLDDVIFIPKRINTVSIEGDVNRQGIFELKGDEDLIDLLEISGGLKITAYLDRAQINRIVSFDQRDKLNMDRVVVDVDLNEIINENKKFELQDGDQVSIASILDMTQNIVDIRGSVVRPGSYELDRGLTISGLIMKADSLLGDAYLERADLVRTNQDFSQELIKVNLQKALRKDLEHDLKLKSMDRIRIYGLNEMIPARYVFIEGHVKSPGKYLLQKNMTLYDLIFKSGGFLDEKYKESTYLKRADLVRTMDKSLKKEIIPFSLERVLKKEDMAQTYLQINDRVRIYSIEEIEGNKRFVTIKGNVKSPGTYELFEKNMTIHDLLFSAGGSLEDPMLKSQTFLDRADLIRYDDNYIEQKIIPFNLLNVVENKDDSANVILKPGDQINVYSKYVFNGQRYVTIEGAINSPKDYSFKNGMALKDLILEAGGVSIDVFRYKVEIARIYPNKSDDNSYAESFIIDLNNDYSIYKVSKNSAQDIELPNSEFLLMPYDKISIRPDPYFTMHKIVEIVGEVYYPGDYTILSPSETIYDIIKRAGGVKPEGYIKGGTVIRDGKNINIDLSKAIKKRGSKNNMRLKDKDIITIPKSMETIQIVGEVKVPGYYNFIKNNKVSDLVKKSGGFTQYADQNNVYITFPNGESRQWSKYLNNFKLLDGSMVFVGKKEEKEPLDITEFSKEIASILASLAQAVSLILIAKS